MYRSLCNAHELEPEPEPVASGPENARLRHPVCSCPALLRYVAKSRNLEPRQLVKTL